MKDVNLKDNGIKWSRKVTFNISASNFLYRFTGCLDLARSEGQKKQRLPQAGTTRLDITPIFYENAKLLP